ncbi:MAG TPA: hypothetical protein VGN90_02435 [Pyrinomonadaceae bacterium]|jgi:hypothetical protein|nr:hypothetical protein [Pyrinomonadaceae bacterium]
MIARGAALLLTLLICFSFSNASPAFQAREHLTPKEIDLVKDAQILDKRIDVFIKAADRRLLALNGTDAANAKQLKKDSESWGELPSGSRAELIGDIARIFDEAITNIDDVSTRDESNPLIPKALRKLAAAATHIVEILKPAEAQAKNDAELNSFDQLTEYTESILQAVAKLPPPVEKKGKTKTEKPKETN